MDSSSGSARGRVADVDVAREPDLPPSFASHPPTGSDGAAVRRRAAADMLLGALVFRTLTRSEPLTAAGAEEVLRLVLAGLDRATGR